MPSLVRELFGIESKLIDLMAKVLPDFFNWITLTELYPISKPKALSCSPKIPVNNTPPKFVILIIYILRS